MFPLAFDDANLQNVRDVEKIVKQYWEVHWRPEHRTPQIIVTSNNASLREWAQTRMKRVDLYVPFPLGDTHKAKLSKLFSYDNRIFEWFSYLYLQKLPGEPGDDELALAREVMRSLYEYAGRPVPEYFPQSRVELIHDPGRLKWHDLIYGLKKGATRKTRDRLIVDLAVDLEDWEVQEFMSYLPPHVNAMRTGHTITIENPRAFQAWLDDVPEDESTFARLARQLFRR